MSLAVVNEVHTQLGLPARVLSGLSRYLQTRISAVSAISADQRLLSALSTAATARYSDPRISAIFTPISATPIAHIALSALIGVKIALIRGSLYRAAALTSGH